MATLFASDATYAHLGAMNELDYLLKRMVVDFKEFMFIQTQTGLILSKNGETIRNLVIAGLKEFLHLFRSLYQAFESMNPTSEQFVDVMHALLIPLQLAAKVLGFFGEGALQAVIMFKMLNSLLPMNTIYTLMQAEAQMFALGVDQARIGTMMTLGAAMAAVNGLMFTGLLLMNKESEAYQVLGQVMVMAAGAMMGYAIAKGIATDPKTALIGPYAAAALGAVAMLAFSQVMKSTMVPPKIDYTPVDLSGLEAPVMDSGGMFVPMYDSGGPTPEHGLAMLQKGETVIPKGQNALSSQGIVINIHGDVYDGDNFAKKVHQALPYALRSINGIGGI